MRLGFWVRWASRDLRARWTVVLAMALVLAIGTGLYASLGAMEQWRVASADASFAALRAHDLRVSLAEGSLAPEGRLRATAATVPGVAEAQERLSLSVQIDAAGGGGRVVVPGRLVGMDVRARRPIDGLARRRGRGLRRADEGLRVAVLEHGFADHHGLPARGTVRIGGTPLRWVGDAMAPEWFIVSREGSVWGAEAGYGVAFTSLATAQRLAGRPRAVNETVVRLAAGADPRTVQAALREAFSARLPGLGVDVTRLDQEPAHRFLYRDAENDRRVTFVFAVLILLGAALAAFNLVSRVVEAQRREIGIGMALGVEPAQLAVRPLLLGLQVGILGAVLGAGVALATAEAFKSLLTELLPLPVVRTPFQAGHFLAGAALGLVIPLAAAALPVWRGVRVAPIEAIRIGFRAAKGAGLAGALRRVPVPGRSLAQMPLRNLLRSPRRTVMTILGVAAVISVVVSIGGMIDSFDATVDQARDEVGRGASGRSVVTLDAPRPVGSPPVRAVAADPSVGAAEPGLRVPGAVGHGRRTLDVSLELVSPRARLWRPSVVEGSFPPGARGILLSRRAADDLGVGVGEPVTVRHPVRTGASTLGEATARTRVAGIHGNPFRQVAILDAGWAGAMRLAGTANTVSVTAAPGRSPQDVQRALAGRPAVASVEEAVAPIRTLDEALHQFGGSLRIGWLFALALAVLMAFNATSINAEERRREHATMFAFGLGTPTVMRITVLEHLALGLLATVSGLLLGLGILGWVIGSLVSQTVPDLGLEVALGSTTLLAATAAGLLSLAAAPVLTVRRLRRMDIAATLRVVE
jgi:putative ABC transport system permease protein